MSGSEICGLEKHWPVVASKKLRLRFSLQTPVFFIQISFFTKQTARHKQHDKIVLFDGNEKGTFITPTTISTLIYCATT